MSLLSGGRRKESLDPGSAGRRSDADIAVIEQVHLWGRWEMWTAFPTDPKLHSLRWSREGRRTAESTYIHTYLLLQEVYKLFLSILFALLYLTPKQGG